MNDIMSTWLLGFDIGGTKCAAILGSVESGNFSIAGKSVFATKDFPSPYDCIENFSIEAEKLLKQFPQVNPQVIGISCGGPLDSKKGIILSPPNLPGWDEIPICEILQKRFQIPVRLCNDADACAVAEWKFGAGAGAENMAFLTFGTGLGAGLILNGKLYSGSCGMAGECGHIRLADDGPIGYGKYGSFEGFCSGGGIAQLGRRYAEKHLPLSWCKSAEDLPFITAKSIAQAADAGDPGAIAVYAESGRKLGFGLAILIDLLNLEKIVIGSVFQRSEHLLRPEMERVLQLEALPHSLKTCQILPAKLGDNIGDIAALSVALL